MTLQGGAGTNRAAQRGAEGRVGPASRAPGSLLTPRAHSRTYLVWALVEHLPRAGELLGVGRVLHPRGARGAGAARGQVSADWLLGHVVGQAGAAGAGRRGGAPAVGGGRNVAFYPKTKPLVLARPPGHCQPTRVGSPHIATRPAHARASRTSRHGCSDGPWGPARRLWERCPRKARAAPAGTSARRLPPAGADVRGALPARSWPAGARPRLLKLGEAAQVRLPGGSCCGTSCRGKRCRRDPHDRHGPLTPPGGCGCPCWWGWRAPTG